MRLRTLGRSGSVSGQEGGGLGFSRRHTNTLLANNREHNAGIGFDGDELTPHLVRPITESYSCTIAFANRPLYMIYWLGSPLLPPPPTCGAITYVPVDGWMNWRGLR